MDSKLDNHSNNDDSKLDNDYKHDDSNRTDTNLKIHSILEKIFFAIFFNISRIDHDKNNIHFINKSNLIHDFFTTCTTFHSKFNNVINFFINLYKKIVLLSRDIFFGYGERTYSYLLFVHLHKHYPEYSTPLLKAFFFPNYLDSDNSSLPIGSWSDIKFFTTFVYNTDIINQFQKNTIINIIVDLVNLQLFTDVSNIKYFDISFHPRYLFSNVAKWIPKEKPNTTLYPFFLKLANHWSSNYDTSTNKHVFKKYRKVVSDLNHIILTFETHSDTNFPLTYKNQIKHSVFHNPPIYDTNPLFLSSYASISPGFLVSKMFYAIKHNDNHLIQFINFKWNCFLVNNIKISRSIPIIDMTLYFHNIDQWFTMIGIACYLSFINHFGKKIIIASNKPIWLDLSHCNYLSDMIILFNQYITFSNSHFSYNLNSSFNLINESFICTEISNFDAAIIDIIVFVSSTNNIITDFSFSNNFSPNIVFWNIGNSFFDIDFIYSIKTKYKLINGNNINQHYYNLFNKFYGYDVFSFFDQLFFKHRYIAS